MLFKATVPTILTVQIFFQSPYFMSEIEHEKNYLVKSQRCLQAF